MTLENLHDLSIALAFLFGLVTLYNLLSSRKKAYETAKQMTKALEKFKLAVDSVGSHVIITDIDGKILYANQAAEKITGYSVEEMLGKTPRLWGGQMNKELYQEMWQKIKVEKTHWSGKIKNRRQNGDIYDVSLSISPILDDKGSLTGFVGIEEDITDLIKSAHVLAEGKAKDEAILASIGDGVIVIDEKGIVLFANNMAQKLLGMGHNQMVGKLYSDVWSVKDGLGNTISQGRPIELVLGGGKPIVSDEYFYTRFDGSDFPVHLNITPVNLEEKLVGVVVIFYDISMEKSVDRAKTEFVSLASHQLRTPLSTIGWYTQMLLNGDLGVVEASQRNYIKEISETNKKMVDLVNSLLDVSRIDLGTFSILPEEMNLTQVAKSVVAELQPQITYRKMTFSESYDEALGPYFGDPRLIRIIISNLITNAIKYTNDGGRIKLVVKSIKKGEVVGGRPTDQDGVLIQVDDSGLGIPDNQKDRIYTKLFRADNVKAKDTQGTGLGLYIVKSILEAIAGKTWFDSVENQGSSFYVLLPLVGMKKKAGTKKLNNDVTGLM